MVQKGRWFRKGGGSGREVIQERRWSKKGGDPKREVVQKRRWSKKVGEPEKDIVHRNGDGRGTISPDSHRKFQSAKIRRM